MVFIHISVKISTFIYTERMYSHGGGTPATEDLVFVTKWYIGGESKGGCWTRNIPQKQTPSRTISLALQHSLISSFEELRSCTYNYSYHIHIITDIEFMKIDAALQHFKGCFLNTLKQYITPPQCFAGLVSALATAQSSDVWGRNLQHAWFIACLMRSY